MAPPQVGRLVATGDPWEPYRLTDAAGAPVEAVSTWFRELQAAGRSPATTRSYGMDLLRWFRFLWAVGVAWDRATRVEARDFCRWLQVAGQAVPGALARRDEAAERSAAAAVGQGRMHRRCVRTARPCCAASTTSTARRAPGRSSTRSRWTGRGGAGGRTRTTTRWSRTATSARASTGRRCRRGSPAASPTSEFNEIFARLPSHRDRALVAFYVSTGARASRAAVGHARAASTRDGS